MSENDSILIVWYLSYLLLERQENFPTVNSLPIISLSLLFSLHSQHIYVTFIQIGWGVSWDHFSCLSEKQFCSLVSLFSGCCDILMPSLPLLYWSGSGSGRWIDSFSDLNSRTFSLYKPHKWVANIYFFKPSFLYPRWWIFKNIFFSNSRTPLIKEFPQGRVNNFFKTVKTIKSSLMSDPLSMCLNQ